MHFPRPLEHMGSLHSSTTEVMVWWTVAEKGAKGKGLSILNTQNSVAKINFWSRYADRDREMCACVSTYKVRVLVPVAVLIIFHQDIHILH